MKEYQQAVVNFQAEVLHKASFVQAPITDNRIAEAAKWIPAYSVNATDALVLQCAVEYQQQLRSLGDVLILVASDQRLLKAAQAEGLATFNPETQSQADLDALLKS